MSKQILHEAVERADDRLISPALRMIDYSMARGWDEEYGGWQGYLHRDFSLSTPLKGGMWKGFFHTPRALWLCWRLLGDMTT